MWGVWEHIHRLYGHYPVLLVQQLQVAGLGGRVARYIDDTLGLGPQNGLDDVGVHAGPWRVGDDDVGASVLCDELVRQDVLHVAGIEQRVLNAVNLGIDLCVLDGLGHILDADDLPCLSRHEVGNGPCAGIQPTNERAVASE